MNISKLFITRPVTTIVLAVAVLLAGLVAYKNLPVNELPNVDIPTITVSASLPGADPETMASAVATPLEKQLSTIAGIDSMSSVSSPGQVSISIQFVLDRDIDAAAQDVQNAISQATKSLPDSMPSPPTLRKVNPAAAPILYLAFTADHLPLTELNAFAETQIAQRLSMVPGVAQVLIFGSQDYAVRIYLNPHAMNARDISINEVSSALSQANTNQPSGTLQTAFRYFSVKADGQLTNAQKFNDTIISYKNNSPIRLRDIGHAEDSVANNKLATWYNGKRGIVLAIQRQPGANTVAVAKAINQLLPKLLEGIPGGVKLDRVYDRSVFIKASINDVNMTLIIAILLVIGVILLFLNNITSTFIAAIALPLSLFGTFACMYLLDYSLDNLSLMGLVLAVGFVVDDAIVVLENIIRYLELGHDRLQAALLGSEEICFTVISMTLSLTAIFIPILFMQGIMGRLFHEFAVVVGLAVLASGIISLTLTPMMCSRVLKPRVSSQINNSKFEKWFEKMKDHYVQSLQWSMARQKPLLIASLIILILTIVLFDIVPKGFIPSEDSDLITGTTKAKEGTTFNTMVQRQQAAADIVRTNPNVESLVSSVGQGESGSSSTNNGRLIIHLKPKAKRSNSDVEIIQQLQSKLQKIPGLQIFLLSPPAIRIGGSVSSSTYQYVLQGSDWTNLQTTAQKFRASLSQISGITDVDSDLQITNPEVQIHILRDKAAALGITPEQIENTLYTAYGESQISTIYTSSDQYDVLISIDTNFQKSFNDLSLLYLRSATGSLVPLTAVTEIKEGVGPLFVSHYGQMPAVTLSFNLAPGTSLSEATDAINKLAVKQLPATIFGSFTGSAQNFAASANSLPILLLFSILIIYMILAILYEHFIHPLTILTALPYAGFGALLILLLFHQELNIFGFIGIIMLIGIVKKNGIMMIDFALEARREQRLSAQEAIIQACSIRFRPIMMTTCAAILATMPIALGLGAGGESRRSLGIAVVGGLLFSQLFTLYVTPVFYVSAESWVVQAHEFFKRRTLPKTSEATD